MSLSKCVSDGTERPSVPGSHLNKKLLQILLELFWVSGDGYRANICVVRHSNHQIFQTTQTKSNEPTRFSSRAVQW